jgi:hypothetical protein
MMDHGQGELVHSVGGGEADSRISHVFDGLGFVYRCSAPFEVVKLVCGLRGLVWGGYGLTLWLRTSLVLDVADAMAG